MADNLDLAIRIRADLNSALRGLNQLEKGVDDVDASMQSAAGGSNKFVRAVTQLVTGDLVSRGFVAIARAAKQFAIDSVKAAVAAESIRSSMEAVSGGIAVASDNLAFVSDEARRLGLTLPIAERAFIALTAASRGTALQGQATREIFSAVAEAGRALGLSDDAQRGALTAIEQIISKVTVSAEELRGQLGERLPGAFQIAARAAGVTTSELDRMLQAGELLAEDFLPKFARELRTTFGESATDAASDASAQFQRFSNEILNLQRAVVQSQGVLDYLAELSGALADVAAWSRAAFEGDRRPVNLQSLVDAYREIAEQVLKLEGDLARSEAGLADQGITGADVDRYTAPLTTRIQALRGQLAELAGELGRLTPRIPGLGGEQTASSPSAAASTELQSYLEKLREQVAALRDLSHEEQVLAAIRSDSLGAVTDAQEKQLLALAGQLDSHQALADAEQRAGEARRHHARELADEAASLDELRSLQSSLADEVAALEGPYAAARRAAEVWRREQLDTLATLAEQGHAVQDLGDVVDRVYREMIASAVREAADAQAEVTEQALRDATDLASGVERGFASLDKDLRDFASLSEGAVVGAFRGMEDALVAFTTTAKLEFSSLVNAIIADLARLAIRQSITLPLLDAFGGLFGGNGLFGRGFRNSHFPPTAHGGGIAGALGTYRTGVSPFAGAPRLHRGWVGGLRDGEIPVILRDDEGVFTPEQMRALGRGGRQAGPMRVDVRVENRGTPQQVDEAQTHFDGERMVIDIVSSDIARGGRIARVLASQALP